MEYLSFYFYTFGPFFIVGAIVGLEIGLFLCVVHAKASKKLVNTAIDVTVDRMMASLYRSKLKQEEIDKICDIFTKLTAKEVNRTITEIKSKK